MTTSTSVDNDSAAADPQAPLERSRFFKLVGGVLFGATATRLLRAEKALGIHVGPPPPCYGFPQCHYCDGGWCVWECYWPHTYPDGHCHWPGQYWEECYAGTRWRCRDWHEDFTGHNPHHCLCRGSIGSC